MVLVEALGQLPNPFSIQMEPKPAAVLRSYSSPELGSLGCFPYEAQNSSAAAFVGADMNFGVYYDWDETAFALVFVAGRFSC